MSEKRKIFVRLGAEDTVISKEDHDKDDWELQESPQTYFIGYELEDGTECNEYGESLTNEE